MKIKLFSCVISLISLTLVSCGQVAPENYPTITESTEEIRQVKPAAQPASEKPNSLLRIADKDIVIGEYFYVEPMPQLQNHGLKLLAFNTKTREIEIEYSDIFGTKGTEICT